MKKKNIYSLIDKLLHSKNFLLAGSLLIILLYFIPYIVLGENFPMTIHDNLDAIVVWVKILIDSHRMFSPNDTPINQVFNGLPRCSLFGSLDIGLIWFKLFGIYWGYIISKIIMALVGFWGMYLILSRHFISEEKNIIIQFGVATIFAMLPFSLFSLSVAGLPLLLYAFLNIRKRKIHFSDWLILVLFPFYSSLIFSGIFFMMVILAIILYDALKRKVLNYHFLFGFVLLGVMYVFSHYRLFFSFLFDSGYVSHRYEFVDIKTSFFKSLINAKDVFINGQEHAQSLHRFIIPTVALCLLLMWECKEKNKKYLLILLFIVLTSLFYGFLHWHYLSPMFEIVKSIIPIQLQRFHWLHPMFWYILFAISLSVISSRLRIGKYLVIFALLIQTFFVFKNHELFQNKYKPTFREFYAENQFNEIKSFIRDSPKNYRVISVGMHPSISQYNGLYTLDGYFVDYPLSYKHQFRKIIVQELDKNIELEKYFDNWGSRCYAFSSELGKDLDYEYSKTSTVTIDHLDFNIEQFKKMGGRFILSSVSINTANNPGFILKKIFSNNKSWWKIYLYEVSK